MKFDAVSKIDNQEKEIGKDDCNDSINLVKKEIKNPFEKMNEKFVSFQRQVAKKPDTVPDIGYSQAEKEILQSIIQIAKNSEENLEYHDTENLSFKKANLDSFLLAGYFLNEMRESLSDAQIKEYETILSDKEQMRKIYHDNYSESPKLRDMLLENFDKIIGTQSEKYEYQGLPSLSTDLNILKYKDKIISFNIFERSRYGSKLAFKAFNVSSNLRGMGLGTYLSKITLDKQAKKNTIVAECLPSKPISSFYIENGFIGRRLSESYGESVISIIRDDKTISNEFKTKNLKEEDIINKHNLPAGTIVNFANSQDICDFSYIIPENYQQPGEVLPYHHAKEKFVLTRYFFNKDIKKWVTVFEKVNRDLDDFL